MSKNEFIDRLRAALNGRISAAQVEDTIQYYQDYISAEIRKGKSEAQVLAMLGDPRLIARTIIETSQPIGDETVGRSTGGSGYQDNTYHSTGSREYYSSYQNTGQKSTRKGFRMPGWVFAIIIILVVYLILSVVFSVLSFLAPVIIVVAAVVFLIKLFRDWLN